MLYYFYQIYYRVKEFFDSLFNTSNKELLENNIDNDLNIKQMYQSLKNISQDFNEKSRLSNIIQFLEEESNYILKNKDNLEVSIDTIKQNTYILDLLKKFKKLEEINKYN